MKPRAFCEFPAGLAAVSLALHGGKDCRPPISRMGNKAGYAHVILDCIGLRRGQGAGAYLWAESDPDVRGLLRAYPDADMLRRIAEIIRGWKDEEPRARWDAIRATGRPADEALAVAGWGWFQCFTHGSSPAAAWTGVTAELRAERAAHLKSHFMEIHARVLATGDRSLYGEPRYRDDCPTCQHFAVMHVTEGGFKGEDRAGTTEGIAASFAEVATGRWPPVAILPTIPTPAEVSAWLGTPGDLDGVIVYADPPYVGTTGYRDVLPRAEVVAYARAFAEAGAHVVVSEACAVAELTAFGWDAVDIGGERRGQKRTFAANAGEWLTSSRPFVHRPAVALSLFGATC